MKKIILISQIFTLCYFLATSSYCQPQLVVSEIGEWKEEGDFKSRWEFTNTGKLLSKYIGSNVVHSYSYKITATKPVCPGMEIGEKPNITYLKIVDDRDGDIGCFYIFGLNDKRLTLIDASTGQIAPFIRVE